MLIESDAGLWAANPDGSSLAQLTTIDYWEYDLQKAIQPGGNLVAFLSPAEYDFHDMSLNLLSLPDGNITQITALTSPLTEAYADSLPGEAGMEALRAVRDQHNLAWSPDGSRLAFVGLMDGPTAEIYVYEVATGEIRRVSQDEAQNYWPSWSPDGNILLYFGAEAFGTGAGFNTTGVWMARGPEMDVTWITVPEKGSEELVGWMDATTAVLSTWTPAFGSEQLRLYDVMTTQKTMLHESPFLSAAADSWRVLYADNDGLYLYSHDDQTTVQLSQEKATWIEPVEAGEYYFTVHLEDGRMATFGSSEYEHQVSPIATGRGDLQVAMYGVIWGWTSQDEFQPGAWITGPGVDIGQIFTGSARLPIWDLHNNLFFFADDGSAGFDLYRTTFDAYYQDLMMVGSVPAQVRGVGWLGSE